MGGKAVNGDAEKNPQYKDSIKRVRQEGTGYSVAGLREKICSRENLTWPEPEKEQMGKKKVLEEVGKEGRGLPGTGRWNIRAWMEYITYAAM